MTPRKPTPAKDTDVKATSHVHNTVAPKIVAQDTVQQINAVPCGI